MPIAAGTRFGPYEIISSAGAGGMGEVYRARDTRLARTVAIKILPKEMSADAQRKQRFEREAKTISSLNHPNICTLHDIGSQDGVDYLVMECVEGETLAKRLEKGPLPVKEALDYGIQIADALEAAHEKGIVHRDLKPANVKITSEGTVKLLDFGLAKAFEGDSSAADIANSPTISQMATRMGVILGTAAYMSPEQARGKAVDRRADIWAFGAVFYEMLTGEPLYTGESASEILAKVIEREPDPGALPPNTSYKLRSLIRRCLVKNPRQRLRDIGDARVELEECLANPTAGSVEIAGIRFTSGTSRGRWQKPLLWALAGVALGAILASMGIPSRKPPIAQPRMMRFSAVTNYPGVDAEPTLSPDGRSVAFVSDRGGQFDIWIGLVTGGSAVQITKDPNLKSHPRWSPDGSKIAYARLNESGLWDIWVVAALGGIPRKLVTNGTDPSWSPYGHSLAYADGATGAIWSCGANGENARQITQTESSPPLFHRQPAFSRDARRLAFVRRTDGPYSEIAVVDLSSRNVSELTDDGALAISPVWSADDRFIYFSSSRGGTLNIWKVRASGGAPEQITAGRGDDNDLDLSEDGQHLVFATRRANVNIEEVMLDSTRGHEVRKWLTTDSARGGLAPAYSPDGHRLAYFTNLKGIENEGIWVMDADGSNPVRLVDDERINIFPRWTTDSQALFFLSRVHHLTGEREVRRFSLSGTVPEKLPVTSADAMWGDVNRNGNLVVRMPDGAPGLFDLKTGKPRAVSNGMQGRLFRWSPDGRLISCTVYPRRAGDERAGLWVYDFSGAPRQVFQGWVAWYAWASADEVFVLQGKPDLNAVLWRVRLDGSQPVQALSPLPLWYSFTAQLLSARFDIHPDRRRIAIERVRFNSADIGMIENIH